MSPAGLYTKPKTHFHSLWYAMTTEDDDSTKQATIRFLAGMGVGGTLAYAQNSLA